MPLNVITAAVAAAAAEALLNEMRQEGTQA